MTTFKRWTIALLCIFSFAKAYSNTSTPQGNRSIASDLTEFLEKKGLGLAVPMALAGKLVSPYKDFGEALGEGNLRGNLGGYLFLYTMFQLGEETCKYLDSNCTTSTAQLQSAAVLSAWSASTQLIASNQLPGATGNVAFQQLNTEFPMSAVAALTNRGIQSWIRERELLGNSTDNWEAWIPTLATGGITGK